MEFDLTIKTNFVCQIAKKKSTYYIEERFKLYEQANQIKKCVVSCNKHDTTS